MAILFGDKKRFAAEVDEYAAGMTDLRRVDLWVAGRWWTCDDNMVFVPQFCSSVQDTVTWLQSDRDLSQPFPELSAAETHRRLRAADYDLRERYTFQHWGPTTDNVTAYAFRVGDQIVISFEFWRPQHPQPEELGKVFVAELPESELIDTLQQLLVVLG